MDESCSPQNRDYSVGRILKLINIVMKAFIGHVVRSFKECNFL